MTTTATLAGGSKQITLANIDGHWRITQIAATAIPTKAGAAKNTIYRYKIPEITSAPSIPAASR